MYQTKFYFFIFFFLLIKASNAYSQTILDFPKERYIFQRDSNNAANVTFSGTIAHIVDSLKIKVYNRKDEQLLGIYNLNNNSKIGSFDKSITLNGGWYRANIYAYKKGQIIDSTNIERFGVGEVFVIAGQSNAQGIDDYGSPSSTDDRVNVVSNFFDNNTENIPWPLLVHHLEFNSRISPNGKSAWCWGVLGDSLSKKLDVPILFFNAAQSGTLSYNWYQSALGIPTLDAIFQNYFPTGYPYQNLKFALNYYASIFGIRAILWHQGETDTYPGRPNFDDTFKHLKTVINKSREDFGFNIPWLMSRVSYVDGRSSSEIIRAQNAIIAEPNFNVFEGPFTDSLQIPRPDGVHFSNLNGANGLNQLANTWLEKLNTDFFNKAKPKSASDLVGLDISCEYPNAKITVPSGYKVYNWHGFETEQVKYIKNSMAGATLIDEKGNFRLSYMYDLWVVNFGKPIVNTFNQNEVCQGDSVLIEASDTWKNILWNTGETTSAIWAKAKTPYYFTAQNHIDCPIQEADSIKILEIQKPENLNLEIIKPFETDIKYFCAGDSILVEGNSSLGNYFWSNGVKNQSFYAKKSDTLSFFSTYSSLNCKSESSKKILLIENPIPQKPVLAFDNGKNILSSNVVENEYNWYLDNSLLPEKSNEINPFLSGTYTLITKNKENCLSPVSEAFIVSLLANDEPMKFRIYPNPTYQKLIIENLAPKEEITIIDQIGREMKIEVNFSEIDVRHLKPGTYYLKIKNKGVYKFIKVEN